VLVPAVVAPVLAIAVAATVTFILYRRIRSRDPDETRRSFRIGQVASASLVALSHGTNDAQKTMGVVVLTLVAGGKLSADAGVPTWVKIACAAAIAAGTFSGGWRVIRTLGTRVTDIQSPQGFSAETASSTTILASSYFGFSLSTTQTVSGGIMGAGLGRAGGVVRWSVVRNMVVAWVLTIPAAGAVGAIAEELVAAFSSASAGVTVVAVATAVLLVLVLDLSRRHGNVTAKNVIEPDRLPAPSPARAAAAA
jgi:inorganic phosphate transporter, PiT family